MSGPRRYGVITPVLCALVVGLIVLQSAAPWKDEGSPKASEPWPLAKAAKHKGQIGAMTLSFARNSAVPWKPSDLSEINSFERRARQHADIVMWFCDWAQCEFDERQVEAVRKRGSVPEISWEPWDSRIPVREPQPPYQLARIIAGEHDDTIVRYARGVAAYGHKIRLRFAHEMNGGAYPWAEKLNNNKPGEYKRMWRHVWSIFQREGATNVDWMWAPVSAKIHKSQYPGDKYVDIVGISGFNGGSAVFRRQWRSFAAIFGPRFAKLNEIAPNKPKAVPEVASTENGGNKPAWIRGMFKYLRNHRMIRSMVWFDIRKESDWRISSTRASRKAFARGAARWRAH
jgi:beta-mannanase